MSYILEALKKAEAKRSDNTPVTFLGYSDTPRRNRSKAYSSAVLISVVGFAGASWFWMAPGEGSSSDPPIAKAVKKISGLEVSPTSPNRARSRERVPTKIRARLQELPQLDRDQFPGFTFSQHIYSEHADLRAVVVNGARRSEGDVIAAGVHLEAVTQTGVVLEYRQYLIEISVF